MEKSPWLHSPLFPVSQETPCVGSFQPPIGLFAAIHRGANSVQHPLSIFNSDYRTGIPIVYILMRSMHDNGCEIDCRLQKAHGDLQIS
jgi:hypothetical protein